MRLATRISQAAQDAALDTFTALLDGGHIEIRTGSQPTNPDTAASGTLLATLTLNNPAFSAASAGVANGLLSGVTATAVASGTAGWCRAYTSGSAAVMDGSCSASGGGGDVQLNSVAITSGQTVTADSWVIELPGA